jgi:hypothetical protein
VSLRLSRNAAATRLENRMPAFPERSTTGSKKQKLPASPSDASQSGLLAQYGIIAVPLTSYEWGGYRYTNAHDAIAAAKRGASE